MAQAAPVIEVEGIEKSFGDVKALDGVDLRVDEGGIVGLLGPNGAGKTTLVRVLATLLQPDAGSARVAGFDVLHDPMRVRAAIGLAGQFAAVDGLLTGRENIEMVGRLYGLPRREARARADELLERLSLTDAGDRLVRGYSGGMRRRLDLGASLVGEPKVLLLDEPTTGLDPRTRNEVWALIEELEREGTTVLLTTQYLDEADRLAERIVVIDLGRVIAKGTPEELKRDLGTDVIDVALRDAAQHEIAVAALEPIVGATTRWHEEERRLAVPASDGSAILVEALRALDQAGVRIEDIALRRPSLDDVFLAITGHGATAAEPEEQPVGRRGRRKARS